MIVKVKYCGGCNASYDRAALVKSVQEAFPSITFAYAGAAREEESRRDQICEESRRDQDFALIVCGCPVRCADYKDFRGSLGRFVVASQSDLSLACQEIERVGKAEIEETKIEKTEIGKTEIENTSA
ncbi:MAG: hypothetical protein LBP21_00190 [Synergistaceae bacterium]|nr:hypothetical protein [Synergistaceae bacterium]